MECVNLRQRWGGEEGTVMLPRFSTRRCFLSLAGVTCLLYFILNLTAHQDTLNIPPIIQKLKHVQSGLLEEDSDTTAVLVTDDKADEEIIPKQPSTDETLPWFMSKGKRKPEPAEISDDGHRVAQLFPQEAVGSDRITNQLMYIPPNPEEAQQFKKILMYNGLSSWGNLKPGTEVFSECPVSTCTLTSSKAESQEADAILYKDHFSHPGHKRHGKQVWILYFLECPYHTQHVKFNDVINWTATYRRDSDIVAPYEKWVYFDENIKEYPGPMRDFVGNKTHKVAWFVSNCGARNGRLQYAQELGKYIQVDIYGACGKHRCPRSMGDKCFEMLDEKYKFYLAFENSNCKDYITEKFFVNGLGHNILPIVMGARPEDYARSAPTNSYIHVDDFESPKHLAQYLNTLDKNDDLYNSYFKWKGTGEFINTRFFCRLCALLHDDFPIKSYREINDWWRGPGVCTTSSWRKKTE
uniref:Fucosyltransferase n=2 Tax=Clastoptera arizonana TaxID=38151 RepID=A0A1B6D299_9HEMI